MAGRFLDIASTPSVVAAQVANGSRKLWERFSSDPASDRLTQDEADFIAARDSFYIASVSETGWPYVQHRGGPAGFLKVLDDSTLGFADFRGNRQYISLGNVAVDGRVALILMDYPNRARLKILARMRVHDLGQEPELAERLATPDYRGRAERAFVLQVEAFDWNCAQHIIPRFTAEEIDIATTPLRLKLAALEAENQMLREQVAGAKQEQGL